MRARSLGNSPGKGYWHERHTLRQTLYSTGRQDIEERWYVFWRRLAVSQPESARLLVRCRESGRETLLRSLVDAVWRSFEAQLGLPFFPEL